MAAHLRGLNDLHLARNCITRSIHAGNFNSADSIQILGRSALLQLGVLLNRQLLYIPALTYLFAVTTILAASVLLYVYFERTYPLECDRFALSTGEQMTACCSTMECTFSVLGTELTCYDKEQCDRAIDFLESAHE